MTSPLKFLFLMIAALSVACSTVPDATDDDTATCPDVQCAWTAEDQCPADAAFSFTNESEDIEGGACWTHVATCAPTGTPAECIPDSCRKNRFTTCAVTE